GGLGDRGLGGDGHVQGRRGGHQGGGGAGERDRIAPGRRGLGQDGGGDLDDRRLRGLHDRLRHGGLGDRGLGDGGLRRRLGDRLLPERALPHHAAAGHGEDGRRRQRGLRGGVGGAGLDLAGGGRGGVARERARAG